MNTILGLAECRNEGNVGFNPPPFPPSPFEDFQLMLWRSSDFEGLGGFLFGATGSWSYGATAEVADYLDNDRFGQGHRRIAQADVSARTPLMRNAHFCRQLAWKFGGIVTGRDRQPRRLVKVR